MYKNQLQELAQRSCFNLPSYSCIREGPDHVPRFKATVNFNGETFESPTFCSTLRQAEHAAAEVALNTLAQRGPSRTLAAKVMDETGVYKNLLQETAHRAGLNLPIYTTIRTGPGHVPIYSCTVELAGWSFIGVPARTKKQAQKSAAMAAWDSLKRLAQHDSSSPSSSSSSSETKGDQEQEQVIIARVLASLRPSESKPSLQTDYHLKPQQSIRFCRDLTQPTPSLYPMHFDQWAFPNYSPRFAFYQMWQQDQLLQLQSHLLGIPISPPPPPPPPPRPQILPYLQSIFQPDHCLFRVQEPLSVSSMPRIAIATSEPLLDTSNELGLGHVRSRSTVTIQEMDNETSEEVSRFSPSLAIPELPGSGHSNAGEDNQKAVECESKPQHNMFEVNKTGKLKRVSEKNGHSSSRPVLFDSQIPHGFDISQLYQRANHQARGRSVQSFRSQPASTMSRTLPQSSQTFVSAPPRLRTGFSSSSARPGPERLNPGVVHPNFRAPPVRIRSIIPLCSAPPQRQAQSSDREQSLPKMEKKGDEDDISRVSSEMDKLQI